MVFKMRRMRGKSEMKAVEGWEKVVLGRLAQLTMGQSPDSKYYSEEENGLPFLQGCAEFEARFPMHKMYCSQTKKLAHSGSILFSVRAPVGKINIADRDYIIGRGLAAISGIDVDQSYLEHYLIYKEPNFRNASQGSTFEAINSAELNGWPINYPTSKSEQTKIAEILSTVERTIEQTEALIAKQQRIKNGLMQDLLTRGIDEHGNLRSEQTHQFKDSPLGRIPVEWDCTLLSRFVPSAEYGISTSLGESGNPVLRMNNFFEGEADISDMKYTDLKVPEKLWLRDGDVLFNRTNSWEHVGRTGIWRGQVEKATFASYLVRLNPDPDMLLSELLNVWLNWEPTQIAMRRLATPAVQQVNINPTNLRAIHAAFPSNLNEQCEIVKRFTSMRNTISSCFESFKKLRSLKTALMEDLLTGKVRVTPLLEKKEVGV
jgi:type I restriction enzyme, S subunit